jgi:hypothetical protein
VTTIIPTADLIGTIGDAKVFISSDKEDVERRCVHLHWTGDLWHASAIDGIRAAVSSWSPDDQPEKDVQGELGFVWGGGDPFEIILSIDDAEHLLAAAKPVKGLEYVPLVLDCDGFQLTVKRAKQTRLPGFTLGYDGMAHAFPDVRAILVEAMAKAEPVKEMWFNLKYLATFAEVRQRGGPAKYTFAGPNHLAVMEIGQRFVGAIMPVRIGDDSVEG